MNPNACPPATQKWCHIVCTLNGRRELLKIPATARFCERAIISDKALSHWTVAAVSISPSRIRALVRTPVMATRKQILRTVKKVSSATIRRVGAVPRWYEPMWGDRHWCSVIRSASALAAVHRSMTAENAQSLRHYPRTIGDAVEISIGEEPARGVHDVLYLGQHKIFKGRGIR